ncbi:ABC-2 type transport system permease protein [Curtobacterium sp. PhB130]|uniref:ABC transporter permease n=1 Tax=Curtobacterium sp. PhB130 TaxID=2485178 RepID=UPI000F4CC484|nr:ABC transporter permease [Curtobacterium sp. PhB130]ROS74902.1 ABC-2 type transport system permease protein [Curtobacterium sp. PhB130]
MTTASAPTAPVAAAPAATRSSGRRYRHALWLLTKRDLRVRYSTSVLGYFWSILDPLVMSAIYWFVFTQVFHRGSVGEEPYIVFLLAALLPWMWFTGAVSDSTRAFIKESKLIRSTTIPRSIWVLRIDASKGIEFLLSIPVLAIFVIATGAQVHWQVVLYPFAIVLQAALVYGIGLIVAPLVVFFRDLERAVKLVLRFAFYASPIIYGPSALPDTLHDLAAINPLTGIFGIYRSAFFPSQLDWFQVLASVVTTAIVVTVGLLVFQRSEHRVLKEL